MNFKRWEQFIHADWSGLPKLRGDNVEKHYFVKPPSEQIISAVSNIESKLSINFPANLKDFYEKLGMGRLCINSLTKVGFYNILAPIEIFDVYFPDEEEDLFPTYRRKSWENLGSNLLAFCLFDEEDSLIYVGVDDQCIYYLSRHNQIAASLEDFLSKLDKEVDYFI